jgi:hypothetical protein
VSLGGVQGPVFIDLDLPVKLKWTEDAASSLSDAEVELENGEEFQTDGPLFDARISDGDTACEMKSAIARWAFPHLMSTIESAEELRPDTSQKRAYEQQVIRGGGWNNSNPDVVRSTHRNMEEESIGLVVLGFRCSTP